MPYGSYLLIEISCKNKHIKEVVTETLNLLKKLAGNKFTKQDFDAVKRSYRIGYHQDAKNNDYYSTHYAEQYINQLFNLTENTIIVSPKQVLESVKKVRKQEFAAFINKLIIFSNLKVAYQGKKEEPGLFDMITKLID